VLTIAINGYDDGASTGEVRRFLGDALGPSDFRKNASRLATELKTCAPALVRLLDRRLPDAAGRRAVDELIAALRADAPVDDDAREVPAPIRQQAAAALEAFRGRLDSAPTFNFSDCSVGNLVFAGIFLEAGRSFNRTVDLYCELVGLRPGLVENVTDGTNAHLVALDLDGQVLATEAAIVDANRRNRIRDIYLLRDSLTDADVARLVARGVEPAAQELESKSLRPPINPRLSGEIARADLIVYAPGTQHSSLFPTYQTSGLAQTIAGNLRAIKLLITNIQADAEIAGASAVDIIGRAVFYLKDKGRQAVPTPSLVTHYLVNDPGRMSGADDTYVPLGRLDTFEDPRLVRIGHYEEGVSGRHDATKVLGPYVSELLARQRARRRAAAFLYEANSPDKTVQTLLEMVRGGIADQPVDLTVFCESLASIDRAFLATLPFDVRELRESSGVARDARLRDELQSGGFEYVVLFESSGMYNGEDIPWLLSHTTGRLDAIWGSRRLSVRDIEESLRLKYRKHPLRAGLSAVGSHALSLQYLLLYGRYVSDTLSGARAVRVADACAIAVGLTDRYANQHLLSRLLRRKAEMFEVPVHFYSLSPAQVHRTTVGEGLHAMATILWQRLRPAPRAAETPAARPESAKA
jgi:2-phospho-L-lactate transferase/gluconeogenesis factor (CofD/UPF0052 family)